MVQEALNEHDDVIAESARPDFRSGYAPIKMEYRIHTDMNPNVLSDTVAGPTSAGAHAETTENPAAQEVKREKYKKNRGMNRKRRFVFTTERAKDLCTRIAVGEQCEDQEKCKRNHNIDTYLSERITFIKGTCPQFQTFKKCSYGLRCEFYLDHFDEESKTSIVMPDATDIKCTQLNRPTFEHIGLLRKKKYDFSYANEVDKHIKAVMEDERKDGHEKAIGPVVFESDVVNKINWKGKTYLAPLTTVGNLPFRRLCKSLGVDITCGEMAMADQILGGNGSELALLRRHPSEDLFGVQLCGKFSDQLAQCTQFINDTMRVDFIDLNLGCPIDIVFEKGCGSGLLTRKTKLEHAVRSMTKVSQVPVTVKLRTGISKTDKIAHEFIPKFKNWGVDMVTLHGRSRQQRYTKLADWDYTSKCAEIAKECGMTFFGNGDVLSYEEYHEYLDNQIDGIMIGRGGLIKPWIFTEIKERRHWDISSKERFDLMKTFCNMGLEHWGSDKEGVNKTRRFLLEWQSFHYRYIPVGLLEVFPQRMNERPPKFKGRDELETLLASDNVIDWIKLSEMFLGKVDNDFEFIPKHKSNSYESSG